MKRPRIMIVSERFFPIIGGAERQSMRLAKYLQEKKYAVFVLTRRLSSDLPKKEKINNTEVYRIHGIGISKLAKLIFLILLPFYYFIFRKKYDIIYFYDIFGIDGLISIIVAKFFNKKIIGIYNNIGIDKVSKLSKFIKPKILNLCDFIVCASKEVMNESLNLKIKKEKHVLIRHSFDTDLIKPPTKYEKKILRKKFGMGKKTIVIFVGRMVPHKRPDLLVDAWTMLKKTKYSKSSILLFIGSGKWQLGDTEYRIRKIVNENNLNNVKFIGDTYEIENYYKAADILVNPAEKDLPSNVVLEAMLSGMATITADIPPNKEVITPYENGMLFKVNNSKDLFKNLLVLISNKKLLKKISVNSAKIKNLYDMSIVNREYEYLFTSLKNKT